MVISETENRELLSVAFGELRDRLSDDDRRTFDRMLAGHDFKNLGFFNERSAQRFRHKLGILLRLERTCISCNEVQPFENFGWNNRECLLCESSEMRTRRNVYEKWERNVFNFRLCPACDTEKAGLAFEPGQAKCRPCKGRYNRAAMAAKWAAKPCGTPNKFPRYCGCELCRTATKEGKAEAAKKASATMKARAAHGTVSMYTDGLCRCELCSAAMRDFRRKRKAARLAS